MVGAFLPTNVVGMSTRMCNIKNFPEFLIKHPLLLPVASKRRTDSWFDFMALILPG